MEDAERGVDARVSGAAVAGAAAEDVRRPGADHVHVGLARVHVRAGDVRAAERVDEIRVALEQAAAVVARRNLRDRDHGLAAAARQADHGELAGHALREPEPVLERVGRARVALQPRSAHCRPERRRVDADEHPGATRLVVANGHVLAVPPPQEILEHVLDSTRRAAVEAARCPRRAPRRRRRARCARGRRRGRRSLRRERARRVPPRGSARR